MDLEYESSNDVGSLSHLDDQLSNLKLNKLSNKSDGWVEFGFNQNDFCPDFGSESDSDSSRLSNMFTTGVNDCNYTQFCDLFSKVLFKQTCETHLTPENHDHTSDLSREVDSSKFELYDLEDGLTDDELERVYWECLEWLVNVFDELNRFESLGFGVSFLVNNLKKISENSNLSKDSLFVDNVEKIKKLIDFINVFRDANSSIYTTYALLDIMETKLNHVRYKSIKILQLKLNNKSKFISSSFNVSSPISNSFDQFDNTPFNTPSSTTTSMSDRGEMDLLYEVWDSKLCNLRLMVFKKFRCYLISVVRQLKNMYNNFNYYQLVQFVVYKPLFYSNTNNNMVVELTNDNRNSNKEDKKEEDSDSYEHSSEYVDCDHLVENGSENKNDQKNEEHYGEYNDDDDNNNNEQEDKEDDAEDEDILEYLSKYYSARNMNEEKADSYVNRIRDLNSRLIPKFVKIITKLPIYYEAFLNALICNNIQDGMFQLISSNGNINYKDSLGDYRDNYKDNYNNKEYREYYKDRDHFKNIYKDYKNIENKDFSRERELMMNKEKGKRRETRDKEKDNVKDNKDYFKDNYRDNYNYKDDLRDHRDNRDRDKENNASSSSNKDKSKENNRENEKDRYKDNMRDGNDMYRENRVEYKSWLQKIDIVKMLNRTNLEVVDAVRCSFNNCRKLVVFSQGSLRDLFNNYGDFSYKDNYKDNYNNKEYREYYKDNYNNKEYKEYYKDRDSSRDRDRDGVIIKNDGKNGSFVVNKMDKDDDEILKRIYYCNSNLSEVASGEVEKVIVQHMPVFSWSPKIAKYQLNLQGYQNNYDYNMNQDLDYNNIDALGFVESNGIEYIEYIKLEEKIWMNRLNMFNRINERNIRNFLMKRNNNSVNKIKYDSSNLLMNYKIPFMVLLDYNNYIPIKYIYNQNNENYTSNSSNNMNSTNYTSSNTNNNSINTNSNSKEQEEKEDNNNSNDNDTNTNSNNMNNVTRENNNNDKVVYRSNNKENKKEETKGDDKDWLIRLFNNNNNRMFKNNCIDIEIERDLFPGFYLFNNFKLNCFILPIHENNFQSQDSFINFSKMLQNKIDLMYPSYLQQINHFILSNNYNSFGNNLYNGNNTSNENNSKEDNEHSSNNGTNKFTGKYGDFFVTYHTNFTIGTKDRMVVNFVFHLVCCDTNMNDDISPIEYAEDTEVILKHVNKIQPVLNGLAKILKVCDQLNVQTVHLPASLKCCYKMNLHNNNIMVVPDFYHHQHYQYHIQHKNQHLHNHNHNQNQYSYFNNQMNNSIGLNSKDKESVIECNEDYVRCLAVVSYLASLLNKNKYSVKNINLIFPQHLNQTLLPKTAVNIFTTRVNTF